MKLLHTNPLRGLGPLHRRPVPHAFTLIEMLVVLGIIVAVLAIALPNLRGLRAGHDMDAATRQLMGDLSLARGRAIAGRTTVGVVFIPSDVLYFDMSGRTPEEIEQIKQLQAGVYTQYALFSPRMAGDQPGLATPRYLTDWRSLPDQVFISESKFIELVYTGVPQFNYADFPFPFSTNQTASLPYVAFDFEGRPCLADGRRLPVSSDIRIPLARGAILYTRDATGAVTDFTVQETPPLNSINTSNHVVIDWMTGRSHLERAEAR